MDIRIPNINIPNILKTVAIGTAAVYTAKQLFGEVSGPQRDRYRSEFDQNCQPGPFQEYYYFRNPIAAAGNAVARNVSDFLYELGDKVGGGYNRRQNIDGHECVTENYPARANSCWNELQNSVRTTDHITTNSSGMTRARDSIINQLETAPLFTGEMADLYNKMPPDQQAMHRFQALMQRQMQMVQLLTNLMQMMHEMAMAVIRNIRG